MLHLNTRDQIERRDETKTFSFDWKVPYAVSGDLSGNVVVGFKYSEKERSSNTESFWTYYHGGIGGDRMERIYANNPDFLRAGDIEGYGYSVLGIPAINFVDEGYDYGEILNGRFDLGWSADLDLLKQVHDHSLYPPSQFSRWGVESSENDYVNLEDRTAGYIMAEINIGERIMLSPGVRFERMHTDYSSNYVLEDPNIPETGMDPAYPKATRVDDRVNEHFFPSINAKFKVNEWSNIRAAYFKSASRPDYRLLSPGLISDNTRENITAYNPYLKPALAQNFDLGVEFYNNEIGFFTINLFYKEITDLIYRLPRYQPSRFDVVTGAPESLLESLERPRE